jgi:hypothetical protein
MKTLRYNDIEFTIEKRGSAWDIRRGEAVVAAGLFAGMSDEAAEAKAVALAKTMHPVGVKVVGPDVAHPLRVGDITYVGPDIAHPNFVSWDKDSASFPKQA